MIALRTSERKQFKDCQWKWERNYLDQLAPKHENSTALWFGTGIHLALEKYYIQGEKRGVDPVETWERYVDETSGDAHYINTYHGGDSTFAVEARELGSAMLRSYIEEYGNEPWLKVLATEMDFQIGINYPDFYADEEGMKVRKEKGIYVGTMDLVYRDLRDGKVYVMDHKTCRALGSANTQYLPLDDQAGAYYALARTALRKKGLIGPKETIAGVVYNYLVKSLPDSRPRNKDGLATNKPTKAHYIEQLKAHGLPVTNVSYATPTKGDVVAALERAGVEFKKSASKADLEALCKAKGLDIETEKIEKDKSVAELEATAAKAGLTIYGEISSSQPTKRFERITVKKSAKQQNNQIKRIADDFGAMSLVRNNIVRATKSPSSSCTFCPFQEICEIDERGGDYTDLIDTLYTEWDPYATHRKVLNEAS